MFFLKKYEGFFCFHFTFKEKITKVVFLQCTKNYLVLLPYRKAQTPEAGRGGIGKDSKIVPFEMHETKAFCWICLKNQTLTKIKSNKVDKRSPRSFRKEPHSKLQQVSKDAKLRRSYYFD